MPRLTATLLLLIGACLGATVSVIAGTAASSPVRLSAESRRPRSLASLVDSGGNGSRLVFAIIGSARLLGRNDGLLDSIRLLERASRDIASQNSIEMVTLGVGIDFSPDESVRWLTKIGGLDEISVGQGWTGIGAQSIAMTAGKDAASVPQVQIRWRRIHAEGTTITAWHEAPVAVFSGAVAIRAALRDAASLEQLIKATHRFQATFREINEPLRK